MDWKKIAPWNWFRDEEQETSVPARRAGPRPTAGGDPLTTLRSEMDRLFDELFDRTRSPLGGRSGLIPAPLRPDVDISEGGKGYTIRAELPGVEPEDVHLEIDGQTLAIRAEKRQEHEEEDEGYHCIERSYGAVQRVLSLPDDADADAIDARFKHGVLTLRVPRHAAPASAARRIEIQPG